MPDIWMDVDADLAEVPVNLLPLCDDTDGKSIEAAIAYNAAGLALYWHFVTTAGAYTVTAVTPTTGGNYDWTDQGDAGVYTIEIPASGGASINNDTEGFGWFTGVATGVLPWRGPVIGFRAAGLNNALIDSAYSATRGLAGTAVPDAAADAAGGLPISDAGGLDIDTLLGTLSNGTYGLSALKTTMDGFATDADIAQATWDALLTAITTSGSIGKLIKDYLDAAISTRSTYAGGAVASVTGSVGSVAAGGISNASFAADVGSTAYASNIIALAVRKVLDELNLDHLAKTATAAADMTTEVADNTILSRILANGDTSAFDPSTDSLEAQSVQAAATSLLLNAVHKGSFQAAADTPSAGYTTWTLYDLDDNLIATFVTTDATGSRAKAT